MGTGRHTTTLNLRSNRVEDLLHWRYNRSLAPEPHGGIIVCMRVLRTPRKGRAAWDSRERVRGRGEVARGCLPTEDAHEHHCSLTFATTAVGQQQTNNCGFAPMLLSMCIARLSLWHCEWLDTFYDSDDRTFLKRDVRGCSSRAKMPSTRSQLSTSDGRFSDQSSLNQGADKILPTSRFG